MTRALVLGGGGPVGIGWESGLIAGLATAGIDLSRADAVVGTSAGSFVGAQLCLGLDLKATVDALAATRAPVTEARNEADSAAAGGSPSQGSALAERMQHLMAAVTAAATGDDSPEQSLRRIGELALGGGVVSEEEFVGFFQVLAEKPWPEGFACTAVDAESGEFVVWREGSGPTVQRAVASSCAVPGVYPVVPIGDRKYMDGGMRGGLNADVATGHDRVLVVSVTALSLAVGVSNPLFDALVARAQGELYRVRQRGEVVVIEPSPELLELSGYGTALMDASRARAAYDAGVRHGTGEIASVVAALWNGGG